MKITTINPEKVEGFSYGIRQVIGQAILSAGTIAFIVQNLDGLKRDYAYVAAAGVVFLILHFSNKR